MVPSAGLPRPHSLCFLVLASACKKGTAPPPPPTARAELPPREVSKDSALLFTYVEPNGIFATTDKAEKVPEVARRLVRIMGQGKGEPQRRNNTNVEVVDLRELLAKGKTRPRVMSREAFETGALAQLPPGDSCPLAGPHGPPLAEEPERAGSARRAAYRDPVRNAWCKACNAARRYLVSNLIPFISKDVEKDPSAARELAPESLSFRNCGRSGAHPRRARSLAGRVRRDANGWAAGRLVGCAKKSAALGPVKAPGPLGFLG